MALILENWKTQIRKGYLELCLLALIQKGKRLYGFQIIEELAKIDLNIKEGTLYPILNRMTDDKILHATWEIEGSKGHPRKFYSLTQSGNKLLEDMKQEFEKIISIYKSIT